MMLPAVILENRDVADGADSGRRVTDDRVAATAVAATHVVLAPDSLLQFVSFAVTGEVLAATRRAFVERYESDSDEPVLLPLETAPLSEEPLHYLLSGLDAASLFLGRWLPLPCFRHDNGSSHSDARGPNNWVRLLLRDDGSGGVRAVLAFDTAVGPTQRQAHLPTTDDIAGHCVFRVPDSLADLGDFVSEPWVDDWLAPFAPVRDDEVESEPPQPRLTALASYLVLLEALTAADVMPEVTFASPAVEPKQVDLVLTLSHDTSAAVFVASGALDTPSSGALEHVPMRDLAEPWICHYGSMPAALAFDRPSFGDDRLSRLSGRTDAFAWPSLARIGHEAARSLEASPVDAPPCGLARPLKVISDTTLHTQIWRNFSADGAMQPFVNGPLLGLLTEAGDLYATAQPTPATTRARFAPSSLVMFAAAELVVQSIAGLNPARLVAHGTSTTAPRTLRRIHVSLPAGLLESERALVEARVRDGIALAYAAVGPAHRAVAVSFAASPIDATRYALLHHDIHHRFAGRRDVYLANHAPLSAPVTDSVTLRSAVFDVGDEAVTLAIARVTGRAGESTRCDVETLFLDRSGIGIAAAIDAVAARIIVPALIDAFQHARIHDAAAFVQRCLDGTVTHNSLADRLVTDLLHPAARALILHFDRAATSAASTPVDFTLHSFLPHTSTVAAALQDRALAAGANPMSVLDTRLRVSSSQVRSIVAETMAPLLDSAGRMMHGARVDVVHLTGAYACLRLVRETLIDASAARPDRIIDVARSRLGGWRDVTGGHGIDLTLLAAAGATEVAVQQRLQQASFLGVLDDAGRMSRDRVVFRWQVDDRATPSATLHLSDPIRLGIRHAAAPNWTARHTSTLAIADTSLHRRGATPLAVTLELTAPEALSVVAVKDARGRDLSPDVVMLTAAGARS